MIEAFARVLLADGVKAMRDVHRHQIRNAGFHNIVEATTSQDALDQITRQTFQLIVWALPLDRGYDELTRPAAAADSVRVPIIVFLKHADAWPVAERRVGLVALRKPISTDSLKYEACRLLAHHPRPDPACWPNEAHRPGPAV